MTDEPIFLLKEPEPIQGPYLTIMRSERKLEHMVFSPGGTPLLTLYADGRIEVDPAAKPDIAAIAFLDSLRDLFPFWVEELKKG